MCRLVGKWASSWYWWLQNPLLSEEARSARPRGEATGTVCCMCVCANDNWYPQSARALMERRVDDMLGLVKL